MNIQIGDTVRFLSEKMEGKVTQIIDRNTVQVYVQEFGFEIPASLNDLVVIHSDIARTQASGKIQATTPISVKPADNVFLAIVPDNFNNLAASRYEFFLVNDTLQTCLYSAAFRNGEKYTGIAAGNCPPDSTVSIGQYTMKDIMDHIHAARIQAIFFQKGNTVPKTPVEAEIKINSVSLCKAGAYSRTRWFSQVALLRPLDKKEYIHLEEIDEQQLQEALATKKHIDQPAPAPAPKETVPSVIEIDLHSGTLLETTAGMERHDILEYQLDVFRKTMEKYKLRRGQKIVFIHGKGEGVLRQRILWELDTKYKRHQHQDASFKQYGYGATLVTIK